MSTIYNELEALLNQNDIHIEERRMMIRRGLKQNLTDTKALPGEFLLCEDTEEVYIFTGTKFLQIGGGNFVSSVNGVGAVNNNVELTAANIIVAGNTTIERSLLTISAQINRIENRISELHEGLINNPVHPPSSGGI